MTRDDLPGAPGSEELESGDDAAAFEALGLIDQGPAPLPLHDAELVPASVMSERELALFADRVERQFLVQRARPKSRLSPKRLLLAGGLFAASAAAAVYVGVVRHSAEPAPVHPSSSSAPSEPAPAVVSPHGVPPAAEPAAPTSPVVEAPSNDERPTEPAPFAPARAPRSDETPPSAPAASAKQPTPASRIGTASRQSGAVAADRLAAANSLRSRHRYREALALYSQVIEIDPNGIQASAARVAAAEMKLEQFGDIAGAERLYREAKTQGGELTAEAQFGLSQVARARGDAPAERRALQDFLARHPESPLVSAARRRLSTLGAE
jgi:tetratricopeptide (TPR) repeat protein